MTAGPVLTCTSLVGDMRDWPGKTLRGMLAAGLCVGVFAGCGEEESVSGSEDVSSVTCHGLAQKLCELGWDDPGTDCAAQTAEELYCELQCEYPDATKQCIMDATSSRATETCFDDFEASLYGEVTSTCAALCQRCDECAATYPSFELTGCYPAEVASADCSAWCETDPMGNMWRETLVELSRPIEDYSCCELSVLM